MNKDEILGTNNLSATSIVTKEKEEKAFKVKGNQFLVFIQS